LIFEIFFRRKSHRKHKAPEPLPGKVFVDVPPHPSDPVELRRQHYQTPGTVFMRRANLHIEKNKGKKQCFYCCS
jgi:hypothetical protein